MWVPYLALRARDERLDNGPAVVVQQMHLVENEEAQLQSN